MTPSALCIGIPCLLAAVLLRSTWPVRIAIVAGLTILLSRG